MSRAYDNGTSRKYCRTDALFNVRHNGVDVAIGVSRKAADDILYKPGRERGSWQVYLTDRPLEERKPAWRSQPIPRMPSLRVSAAERAKLLERLIAVGTMHTVHDM